MADRRHTRGQYRIEDEPERELTYSRRTTPRYTDYEEELQEDRFDDDRSRKSKKKTSSRTREKNARNNSAANRKRKVQMQIRMLIAVIVIAVAGLAAFFVVKAKITDIKTTKQAAALQAEQEAKAADENAEKILNDAVDAAKKNAADIINEGKTAAEIKKQSPFLTDESSVSICMVGDLLLHDGILDNCGQNGYYDFNYLFENVRSAVQSADVAVINMESTMGDPTIPYTGYPTFYSPKEASDAIVNAGFDVVLQASNHTLDYDLTGLSNTLNTWASNHPDIHVLGIHFPEYSANNIYVYEKNGIRVAFLNYTYGFNENQEKYYTDPTYQACIDTLIEEKVRNDIQKAHALSDFVVVCPHWGTENTSEIDEMQETWTEVFLSEGVNLVLGSHPHVMQPAEMKTREDGHQMLVYYSVGNFISNQEQAEQLVGAMAEVKLTKSGDQVVIDSYGVKPMVTHKDNTVNGPTKYTTYFLEDYTQDLAMNNYAIYESPDFSLEFCYTYSEMTYGDILDLS